MDSINGSGMLHNLNQSIASSFGDQTNYLQFSNVGGLQNEDQLLVPSRAMPYQSQNIRTMSLAGQNQSINNEGTNFRKSSANVSDRWDQQSRDSNEHYGLEISNNNFPDQHLLKIESNQSQQQSLTIPVLANALEQNIRESQVSRRHSNLQTPLNNGINGSRISNQNLQTHQGSTIRQSRTSQHIQNQSIINRSQMLNSQHSTRNQLQTHNITNNSRISNSNHSNSLPNQPSLVRQTTVQGPQQSISKRTIVNSNMNSIQTSQVIENNNALGTQINNSSIQQQQIRQQQIRYGSGNSNISKQDNNNYSMRQSQQSQRSQHVEQSSNINQSSKIITNGILKNSIQSQIGSGIVPNHDQTQQINHRLAGSIVQSIQSNKSINNNGMYLHQSQVKEFDQSNLLKMHNISNDFPNNIPLSPRASGASNVIVTQVRTSKIQQIPSNIIKSPRQSMISQQSRQNQMRQSNIATQNQIRSSQINKQIASGLNNIINQNLRNSSISRLSGSGINHGYNATITPAPVQSHISNNQHIINISPINETSVITSRIFENNIRTSQVAPTFTTIKKTTTIVEQTPIGPPPQLLIFQQFFLKIKQMLGFDMNCNKEQTIQLLTYFINNNKYQYQQLKRQLQQNIVNRQQSQQQINYLNHQKISLDNELNNLKHLLQQQNHKNQLIQRQSNQSRIQFLNSLQSKQNQYNNIINNLKKVLNEKQQRSYINRMKLQQNSQIKKQLTQKIMFLEQDYRNNLNKLDALKNQTQQSATYWERIAQELQRNKSFLEQDVLNKQQLIQNIQKQKQRMNHQMNHYINRISNLEYQQTQARNQISSLQHTLANNQHSTHTTSIHQTHHRQIIQHQTHIAELQRIVSNLQAITMQRDNLIKMTNSLSNQLEMKNNHIQQLITNYEAKIFQLNTKLHMSASQFEKLKVTMQSHVSITVQNQIDQLIQDNNILIEKSSRMEKEILQNKNKYSHDEIVKLKLHYQNQLQRFKNLLNDIRLKSQADLCSERNRYSQIINNLKNQIIKYQQLFDEQKNRLLVTQINYSKLKHQNVGEKNISINEKQKNQRLEKQLNNCQLKNQSLESINKNLQDDCSRLQNTIRENRSQRQRIQTNYRTQITRVITDKSKEFDSQKNSLLHQLQDRQSKINHLLNELKLKNVQIENQQIRNISLNSQPLPNTSNLHVEIQQKNQIIINLNSQIVALNNRLILLENKLNEYINRNSFLEDTMRKNEMLYLKQNYTLKERIQELQFMISQLKSEQLKNNLNKHIQTATTIVPSSKGITSFENIISHKIIQQPVVNAVSRVEIQKRVTNFDTPSSVTRNQSIEKLKTASRINYTQIAGTPIHTANHTISRTITADTAVPSYPNSQLTYAPKASFQAPMTSSSKRVVVNRSPTPPRQVEIIRRTPPKIQQVKPVINYQTTTTTNVKSANKFASRLQKPRIIQNRPRMQIKVSKPSQNRQRSNSKQIVRINRQRSRSRSPIRLPLSPPARIDNHNVQTNRGLITTNIRSPIVTTQTLSNVQSTPSLLNSHIKVDQMNTSISKQIVQKSFHQQQLHVSKLSSVQDNTFKPTIQSFVSQGQNGMMLMQKDTIVNGGCCNFKP